MRTYKQYKTMTADELADRLKRGEKWKVGQTDDPYPPMRDCDCKDCKDCKPSFDESEIGDGFYYSKKLPERTVTKDEALKQAKILVTVLLTDDVISKQEAETLRQALDQPRQECETCANKRRRLEQAGFLKSPLRGGEKQFFYGQDPNVLPASNKGESHE